MAKPTAKELKDSIEALDKLRAFIEHAERMGLADIVDKAFLRASNEADKLSKKLKEK